MEWMSFWFGFSLGVIALGGSVTLVATLWLRPYIRAAALRARSAATQGGSEDSSKSPPGVWSGAGWGVGEAGGKK